jgi:hypothetical protein
MIAKALLSQRIVGHELPGRFACVVILVLEYILLLDWLLPLRWCYCSWVSLTVRTENLTPLANRTFFLISITLRPQSSMRWNVPLSQHFRSSQSLQNELYMYFLRLLHAFLNAPVL